MAFTISNSVEKRLENAAFARSGKLQKNIQENYLFIVIFLVLDNMHAMNVVFSLSLRRVNSLEFSSHSPFRKINGEREFLCRVKFAHVMKQPNSFFFPHN